MSKINAKWINLDIDNMEKSGNNLSVRFSDEDSPELTKVWSSTKIDDLITTVSGDLQTHINEKLSNVIEDASPKLGGDIDVNEYTITGNNIALQTNGITTLNTNNLDINLDGTCTIRGVTWGGIFFNFFDGTIPSSSVAIMGGHHDAPLSVHTHTVYIRKPIDMNDQNIVNAGIITANMFYGDGSNLTGISDHGALIGLSDDDHTQYILHTYGIGTNNLVGGSGAGNSLEANSCYNNIVGSSAGAHTTTGNRNVFVGEMSGATNTTGSNNVYLGFWSGKINESGSGNVCIGHEAGMYEKGSGKLYIENTGSSTPLIYGEFDNNILTFNADVTVTGSMTANAYYGDVSNLKGMKKQEIEYFTLCAASISDKYVILAHNPINNEKVVLDIIHGGAQEYGIDYTVVSGTLCWQGLALESVLEIGDKFRVMYGY